MAAPSMWEHSNNTVTLRSLRRFPRDVIPQTYNATKSTTPLASSRSVEFGANDVIPQTYNATKSTTPLASSRSVEFGANGTKLAPFSAAPAAAAPHRLPTPIRKNVGRSMIPSPRTSLLTRS
ncbi:unnamed protein product [Gongylonema pulchrum]|uniref:Uncharacterized protein n=1 Tax=Gongylonema pulchrum TaxID=637853 RepID=A0A183E021_9BILA|nr:unnamed protein product [Gongylonema pulchrum]